MGVITRMNSADMASLVPNPDDLLQLSEEEQGRLILKLLASFDCPVAYSNFFNCANDFAAPPKYESRQKDVDKALQGAWAWLAGQGLLAKVPAPGQDWFFVPKAGHAFLSQKARYEQSEKHDLLKGAEKMFSSVINEVEPYNRPERLVHMLFFRRFIEWQYEYCRSIRTLYEANCLQGSMPILRSLVEVSAAQVLLHRDDADFPTLLELLKGECIKTNHALKQIEWPASQNDIYAQLSLMTHPSRISAFLGKTLDFESEPLNSLFRKRDIAGVARFLLWQAASESEEAHQERWMFIALNTFDLAVSCLRTLYGEQAPEQDWWDQVCISIFESLAESNPRIKNGLLWFRLEWPHSKRSKLQKEIDHSLNRDNGTSD